MIYVALLRGINVGGARKVEMIKLKQTFDALEYTDVKTYINSGNVIFSSPETNRKKLAQRIEHGILLDFNLEVPVVMRSLSEMKKLVESIPKAWVNDDKMRCDILFLWEEVDSPKILQQIPHKPDIEDVVYFPGAVVWRIDRVNVNRGAVIKILGTDTYKKVTIRNANTVRKLLLLMEAT